MPSLEETVTPLVAGWLSTEWFESEPSLDEAATVASFLEGHILTSQAETVHYLFDIASIAARARTLLSSVEGGVVPDIETRRICTATDDDIKGAARTFLASNRNRKALSIYMYLVGTRKIAAWETVPIARDAPASHFRTILKKFGTACKFKLHGDMYIWGLIRLKMPAWIGASYQANLAPWGAFAVAFPKSANEIGRDIIGTSAVELLDMLTSGEELFTVIVAILFELVSAPGSIVCNSLILTADPLIPTPYASCDFVHPQLDSSFGYVYKNIIYTHEDPWIAAAAWLVALDDVVSDVPDISAICLFIAESVPIKSNPYYKFI